MGRTKGSKNRDSFFNGVHPGLVRGSYEYTKSAYLKHAYGITLAEYDKMFADQMGRCAICGRHQSELRKKLHVDHCHKTRKVRGLLCFSCNAAIGHFLENPDTMKSACKYLEKN